MPILPCKRLVGVLVSSAEDYKEPEEAFKKVIGDKIGFEDYFLNKLLIRERLSVIFKNSVCMAKFSVQYSAHNTKYSVIYAGG